MIYSIIVLRSGNYGSKVGWILDYLYPGSWGKTLHTFGIKRPLSL